MTDKILTLHPDGKQGVNIDRTKYMQMKQAILHLLNDAGELNFTDAGVKVEDYLEHFQGSVMWYFTTVKMDLHARNILHVCTKSGKQYISLNQDYSKRI